MLANKGEEKLALLVLVNAEVSDAQHETCKNQHDIGRGLTVASLLSQCLATRLPLNSESFTQDRPHK